MFRVSLQSLVLCLMSLALGTAFYIALVYPPSTRHLPSGQEEQFELLFEEDEEETNEVHREDGGGGDYVIGGQTRRLRGAAETEIEYKTTPTISELTPKIVEKFPINEPFHFPLPLFSRSKSNLLSSQWLYELHSFLRQVKGQQVSLVTASIEHLDVLLNWLISAALVATPPLENVLVLTLDLEVYKLTSSRNISTLYVSEDMVVDPSANITRRFSQVHIVRLTVIRLINHYGNAVVNYDCDAIVLRNPQTIFDGHRDADLIGTFGKGPGHLYHKWGITLNTGVMLLRSNSKIEYYWELMSSKMKKHATTDDQANINLALSKANVKWFNVDRGGNIDYLHRPVYGLADSGIVVMLLPENQVCRYVCDPLQRDDYYVWHTFAIKENRTVVNKMSQAKVGNAWFLRSDWSELSQEAGPRLVGVAWLRYIADSNLIR